MLSCTNDTAAGSSKVTVGMIVTLSDCFRELITWLVDLVFTPGVAVYEQWKRSIISSMPKEKGNFSLYIARPIVLLDVLEKTAWSF